MVDIAACKRAALFYIMVSCLRAGTASGSPRPRHRACRPSTARQDVSPRGILAETPAHLGHRCRRRHRPLFILRCIRSRLRCIQTRTSPRRTNAGSSDWTHVVAEQLDRCLAHVLYLWCLVVPRDNINASAASWTQSSWLYCSCRPTTVRSVIH